jgi:eukaryotic-like serine/threonine-protein kinase
MSLAAGTQLGPYVIEASLGAGGMGEVYRARDTRLDRIVAIKVLTAALAADPESRQRFEQEARSIAALNDPHICTIHDVGRHDTADYLVLEYLEGETLADRLGRTPALAVADALAIALQVGEGLDRAHRAGIIHRDLKPGNVMLISRRGPTATPDVKLLDFGLASRVVQPVRSSASLDTTSTLSLTETRPAAASPSGFTGTVHYMAPEQLEGHSGDHRVDIFAFGCVLYEMLAGRKAFDGGTALTVIAAISSSDPPPIPAIESGHPLLDHVLRRCLEKDPERRWQHIRDVTGELRWILTNPTAVSAAIIAPSRSNRLRSIVAAAVLAAVGFALTAGVLLWRGRDAPARHPPVRFEIATEPTDDPSIALSPDGRQIAFVANKDRVPMLWVRSLDAIENRALPGTNGASYPFWSPDGRTVGFFADAKLKRIDVAGGTPLVIADAPNGRGGTWNSEGVILFAPGVSAPIMRVSTRGGPVEAVTQVNAGSGPNHRSPQFLPDGSRFLFSSTLGTAETNGVYLASLDKTAAVRLLSNDGGGRFAAPNRLLAIRQGALHAYPFDAARGIIDGEPVVIAQGVTGAGAIGVFATSDTGVLAYRSGTAQRRQLAWVDRHGAVLRTIGEPRTDYMSAPELSGDDQSVVVFVQPAGDNDVWAIELARNLPRRITDGPPADAHPLWDPDGQHVVFFSRRFGGGGPARQAVSGGTPEPLFAKAESGQPLAWSRDRQYILLRRSGANTRSDLVAVATRGAPREVVVAQSPHDELEGQFSSDGKWVALVSLETGRAEVFLQSFPQPTVRMQVSTAGGSQVRWSADDREIFYIAPDGGMMAVPIVFGSASPTVKLPQPLFQAHLATGPNVLGYKPQYAVSRDGRFLLNTAIESATAPIVVGSTGWSGPDQPGWGSAHRRGHYSSWLRSFAFFVLPRASAPSPRRAIQRLTSHRRIPPKIATSNDPRAAG